MKIHRYEDGNFNLGISESLGSRDPHMPTPDPITGTMVVDPDIALKALGFDIQIDFFYSTEAPASLEYGYGRSANIRAYARYAVGALATLCRGDFTQYVYSQVSASGTIRNFVPVAAGFYAGGTTTLVYDGATFTEYFQDGMQMKYASTGAVAQKYELSAVVAPTGVAHTYTYGTGSMAGLLQTIQEPAGRVVSLNYIASHPTSLVNSVEDWSGRRWSFAYDAARFLIGYTTPTGCETQYGYVGHTNIQGTTTMLAWIEDPRGFVTSYGLDGTFRVTSMIAGSAEWTWSYGIPTNVMESPTGALTTSAFDDSLNPSVTQYPEGFTATFAYLANRLKVSENRPSGNILSLVYNSSNQIAVSADSLGNLTTLQYDSVGNLTTTIDALGNDWVSIFDTSRNKVGTIDPLGRRTTATFDSFGNRLSFRDGRGLATTWLYDPFGNPTTQINSDGGIVKTVFDNLGRPIAVTDPINRTTSFTYDAADHVVSTTNAAGEISQQIYLSCLLQASIDGLGNRTTYTYGRFSNQLTMQNALGFVWTNLWDNMGFQVGTIDPLGNQTTAIFNPANQKIADVDQLGFPTSYFFDSSARPLATENARGFRTTNIWNPRDIVGRQDALNNVWTTTFDALDRAISSETPLGFVSRTNFDASGQAISTQNRLGYFTTSTFDSAGNRATSHDANNLVTTFLYSSTSNRLAMKVDPMGFVTSNVFDLAGQQINLVNALGHPITFGYDLAGRQNLLMNELGFATSTSFDDAGRPVTVLDANNWLQTLVFDAVGQNLVRTYGDGAVSQAFDPIGNRTTLQDETGTTTYAYSPRSELLRVTSPANVVVSYQFNSVGSRSLMVDPDGGAVSYTRDPLDRVGVQALANGYLYTAQFDADGNRTTLLYGNSSRRISYDALGRVATQVEFSASTPISTIVDSYDPGGRKIGQVRDGVKATYSYSPLNQLVGQQKVGAFATFAYDSVQNRTVKWHQGSQPATATYDVANRQIKIQDGPTAVTYVFDNNGNTTAENRGGVITGFTYNRRNREHVVSNSDGTRETMMYDGDGLRRTRQTSSGLTTFVWDGVDYLGEIH